jgi:hypothetical protein
MANGKWQMAGARRANALHSAIFNFPSAISSPMMPAIFIALFSPPFSV